MIQKIFKMILMALLALMTIRKKKKPQMQWLLSRNDTKSKTRLPPLQMMIHKGLPPLQMMIHMANQWVLIPQVLPKIEHVVPGN